MVKIALFQSQTGIDPAANATFLADAVRRAADGGAAMLFTPEMSGLLDRDADRAAIDEAMARLAIADLADRQLHDLSGGQRQRVLVAQGLAQEFSLLLLDEPVTGLDVVSRSLILEVIDEERAKGKIVLEGFGEHAP